MTSLLTHLRSVHNPACQEAADELLAHHHEVKHLEEGTPMHDVPDTEPDTRTWRIRRFYFDNEERNGEIVAEGLSLDEAGKHLADPETSSKTAVSDIARARTARYGEWFEGRDLE